MKKILTLILCLCSFAFAFGSSHDTEANIVYLKDTKLQIGAEGTIDLMLKSENPIGSINVTFDLPAGITINSIVSEGANVTWNPVAKNLLLGKGDPYYTTGKVATINVTVAANAAIGNQTITLPMVAFVQPDLTTFNYENVTSDLALQRAAVIDPMEDGYALEIVPFVAQNHGSQKTLSIRMKNAAIIKGLEFDIELPKGLLMCDTDNEWETTEAKINTAACTNTTQDNVKNTNYNREGQPNFVHVAFNGAYSSKGTKRYINQSQDYQEVFTLNTYVACDDDYVEEEGDDYWPRSIYELENGVNTLKLSNIKMTDKDGNIHTGSYSASVFAGNTTSDANPILYGHYTSDVVAALAGKTDVKAMLSNDVASVDVTAATIDGDASALFNGNLVYAPTKTSYSRTTGEWGSICLPIALENDENFSYYEVKELNIAEGKVVLGKITGTLEANTPAFYNTKAGSISAEAEGYLLAETPSTAAELVGVYEKTTLAPNAGYYISGGKLYNDGATVKPFRAYLNAPTAASKELKIFVDESTGLRDVTAEFPAEAIYNLQGMKLQQTQRGINIIGGKKVLIKK